ncbi:MAG: HEAT repeat domain-containing protein [Proteobacteria bacterium]|nr:HEAT repeat domain-containing protein [Pseudomonadota bacterium]
MTLFSNLRASRLIAQIKAAGSPQAMGQPLEGLRALGDAAVPMALAALDECEVNAAAALGEVLISAVNERVFDLYLSALASPSPRCVAAGKRALSMSRAYPTALLLQALCSPQAASQALREILQAQRQRLVPRELLAVAYKLQATDKALVLRLLADLVGPELVPDLISRLVGKDAMVRLHLVNILARFNLPQVKDALSGLLQDPNKMIRAAALSGMAKLDGPIDLAAVCQVLRDTEIDVQNHAIDVLVKAGDPMVVRHLVAILKDESEYARRAAVEVLNELADPRLVKFLLAALKDADWWVRSRAGDALGKIGGPRVIQAVLELARDDDADIRRSAIEILNQTRDESAVNHLLEATHDTDWWVRERAVDALAAIGSPRALPRLLQMLQGSEVRSLPVVVHALSKLGDARCIDALLPLLHHADRQVRQDTILSVTRLTDERRVDAVQVQLQAMAIHVDPATADAAIAALNSLEARFGAGTARMAASGAGTAYFKLRSAETPRQAGNADNATQLRARVLEQAGHGKLDLSLLRPGDLIEGRYKYMQRIGKGAFGTVVLVEDTVVDDQLILKFLNPSVCEDEEVLKRFVHELRYSRKITHRNIIRIYDFLRIQGNYAISMEYFPSHTLTSEVEDGNPLPVDRLLQYGIDICTGMNVAHTAGIVHRDLKPANVLINGEGLLKIVDFGVAAAHREGDTQLTRTGYVIGSPKYMAPEQIMGRRIDERADIYSTGIMLYEMATGAPPYANGDHMAVMYQHVQGKARPPHELNAALPESVSAVILKAMATDKLARFQTMPELCSALEKLV